MAKSGHAPHPATCSSDAPELRMVMVACVGHGEAFCTVKMDIRVAKIQIEMQPHPARLGVGQLRPGGSIDGPGRRWLRCDPNLNLIPLSLYNA